MRRVLLLSIISLFGQYMMAQNIIEYPSFSATTAGYVKINQIELLDTTTIIDFEVLYRPNYWIQVSSDKTYIQNSQGGEKLYVYQSNGIKLNEKHWTPEDGINRYTLYFPPLEPGTEQIDFIDESWKTYGINLLEGSSISFIPEELQGNWLKTDGSNDWVYGIYDDRVICNGEVWDNILIKNKGKNYELSLRGGSKQEILYLKLKKGDLLAGSATDSMQLVSKDKTINNDYFPVNDFEFTPPVFNLDTAIYKGYIQGYNPGMGETGLVYVNDIIIHEQSSYLITIEPDGTFHCEVPMIYPQEVYVRMLNMNKGIFLEPGKTTFQYIDLKEDNRAYASYNDWKDRKSVALFMGETTRINTDLSALESIRYYDHREVQKLILDMTGEDYKTYCLGVMNDELKALDEYKQNNIMSMQALQVKTKQIHYQAYENILSYNMRRSSAYRQKNKIPRDQREIPLKAEVFSPEYYDFINADELNDPISLISGGAYNILINRIRFSKSVRPTFNITYLALKDSIEKKNISLSEKEEYILDKLIACENYQCIKETVAMDSATWGSFNAKHAELISSVRRNAYSQSQVSSYEKYFGIREGLVSDIMYAQQKSAIIKGQQKSFNESDKLQIRDEVSDEFIQSYLIQFIETKEAEIAATLEANTTKTGYTINETPKSEGDKLFDAIMAKYRDKVVYVDFWATWCGPCRSGMERIKPLKEELVGEDIVFVYITNQSSPQDIWNMMVPNIKGEHYRVEEDEWNHLSSRFKITGIPHYVLVDKDGKVVKDKVHFVSSNEELKKMFNKYLLD